VSYIFAQANSAARRLAWLALIPALAVCSSDGTTVIGADSSGISNTPGTVSDLSVSATSDVSATLAFTQVDDGTGHPASYDVRYKVAPMDWGTANSSTSGTCTTPLGGTKVGSVMSCTVTGLSPSTSYNFQLIALRGAINSNAKYGGLSNLAAASTTATPTTPPVVTSVAVTPALTSVMVGATTPLQATVKDAQGNPMSAQAVTWSTSSATTATVDANGVVTGVAPGTVTIMATSSGKSGTSSITVTSIPPVVTTVTVAPSSASVAVGATTPLTATVKDQQGNVMAGQTVTWSTSSSATATVSSSGVVTGVAAGPATITVTSSGKSGTSSITVTAVAPLVTTVTVSPGSASIMVAATTPLSATVKDQQGNVMAGQTVTWTTSNAATATVNSSGVVTGVAAGGATITATSSGKTGTSAITVTAASGGATLLLAEDFEDANIGARGWYDNTSALITTAEHIAGSTSSAQYHYLQGQQQPTTGGAQRHKFTPTTSLYVSYYVKYTANWVGSGQTYHPHEFYAMTNLDDDYNGPANAYMTVYLEQNYQNGGKPALYIQDNKSINTSSGSLPNNLVNSGENRSTSGCNGIPESVPWSVVSCYNAPPWYNAKGMIGPVTFQPNPGAGYKNDWNFVEAYYQLNTIVGGIGQHDGVLQYWFNGTLIIDRHDVVYRTGMQPTMMFNQFLIAPYIGDGSPVDQSMFIDNLRLATGRLPQ
jgi:uncharacterized protein YjdB